MVEVEEMEEEVELQAADLVAVGARSCAGPSRGCRQVGRRCGSCEDERDGALPR